MQVTRRMLARFFLAVAGFGIAAVALIGRGSPPPTDAGPGVAKGPIIHAGTGTQTTLPFYLSGGTYRTQWSAWERAPEYPPCTHSVELMAVDPANATTSLGHVLDLARSVQVPATGGSNETYLINVKPGDYYLHVNSECGWQIAIMPN